MNMQKGFAQNIAVLAVVGVLVVAGIVWAVAANSDKNEPEDAMMENKNEDESMMPKDDAMMEEDKMDAPDAMMEKPGAYKDYSEATVMAEQAAGNKVVLFFHAPWCPFCKAADAEFKARLGEIPAGVTVLKTDYDSNTELKQKYGVTYQHTFVQVDNNLNQVSKWNGGDLDNLKKYLK